MMKPVLVAAQTKSGRAWKVYVWKQHSGHLMDWNGCNYRLVSVPGQPRGFSTSDQALSWAREWLSRGGDPFALAQESDGTHLGDNDDRCLVTLKD